MRVFSGFPPAAHRSASAGLAIALALAATLAVGACKRGSEGDAQAKEAAKGPEAVPVEVAQVSRRPIAASYSGTAPLDARGESQVVAKTSGVALQVLAQEGQACFRSLIEFLCFVIFLIREFRGQGLSNIVGGMFSSYVSCGSLNRSLPNYEAGARTPLAAVFASLRIVGAPPVVMLITTLHAALIFFRLPK